MTHSDTCVCDSDHIGDALSHSEGCLSVFVCVHRYGPYTESQ